MPSIRSPGLTLLLAALLQIVPIALHAQEDRNAGPQHQPPSVLEALPKGQTPVEIQAQRLEYWQELDLYVAEGRVAVTQEGMRLTADRVMLDNKRRLLIADGHVEFSQAGQQIGADRMELEIDTSAGILYQGRIEIEEGHYRITGERMARISEDRYDIRQGTFTTCDICDGTAPDWQFRANRLRLRLDGYGIGSGVAFYIKGIPTIYLPYAVFPVKTTRQSGFLVPRIGFSTRAEGFKYLQPLYLVLGRSHDATLSLDYRSEKGIGGMLEYRYVLGPTARGRLETLYFQDRDIRQEQVDIRYQHDQTIADRVMLKADGSFLNREDVRRDLSTVTAERSQVSVESNLFAAYRGDDQALAGIVRIFQNLVGADDLTLQRLPEVRYLLAGWPIPVLPLYFGGEMSLVHFWRQEELEHPDPFQAQLRALRLDVFPKLWWPLPLGRVATLTPEIGFRETYYSRSVEGDRDARREIAYAAVTVESPWAARFGRLLHILEPQVQYEYAEAFTRRSIPQFDELDLGGDKHLLTYGLLNRFRMPSGSSGSFRLTQSYHLDSARRDLSDLRAEAGWTVPGAIWFDLDAFFNHEETRFSAVNSDLSVLWSPYFETSVGQRYARRGSQPRKGDLFNPLSLGEVLAVDRKVEFLTVGGRLFFPWLFAGSQAASGGGVHLAAKAYYNPDDATFSEIDYGVKFASECWEVVLDYRDFPEKNEFSFLITLKGAASLDSRAVGGLFEEKSRTLP